MVKADRRSNTPPPTVQREQFASNKQWTAVPSRYAEAKPNTAARPVGFDTAKPLLNWSEHGRHESLAKTLGFGAVPPRFWDHAQTKWEPAENSPRRVVAERREAQKQKPWQSAGPRARLSTFDDMLPEFYAAHAELAPKEHTPMSKSKAFSTVGDYIRSGTPIKHHGHTTEHKERVRRHQSPQPFRSPGVVETEFDNLRKSTRKRGDFMREEARVAEERSLRQAKVVPRNFTPRVAMMAPAYQLSHIPDSTAASTTNGITPRGKSRSRSPEPRG
jgi:hypothetical protein